MQVKDSRRTFFKRMLSLSAFSAASCLSFSRGVKGLAGLGWPRKAHAMNNPDYASGLSSEEIRIEYMGMSCFLITTGSGARIITDPFHSDNQILYPDLRKEPADMVTVSCGNYAHCNVYAVGGMPYVYRIKTPTTIEGIPFRGISSRHLEMKEVGPTRADENIIMCFEAAGIRICHLGALGHPLTEDQRQRIGKVDVLMVPVGGVSTLPVADAEDVCRQLAPGIIIPMHYRSERCTYSSWAPVDEFVKGKENVTKFPGLGEVTLSAADLPPTPQILLLEAAH